MVAKVQNQNIMSKKSGKRKKGEALWPWLKWLCLFLLVPAITLLIQLITSILGQYRSISCTDILAASIALSLACFIDISASTDKNRDNYLVLIAITGFVSIVVFTVCIEPEVKFNISTMHYVFTGLSAGINAILCWIFTFFVNVKKRTV